ncbi:hypothetical protein KH5H1_16360 [Corallococcus caeni]|uniref:hypothetical protein n=1 Tax=Corallococcus caeni TaxID=3082388 RepID=UPI0029563A1B|nr:hypothetical protein KH5H1_16360 [Corallococcus sp. KH5-1]
MSHRLQPTVSDPVMEQVQRLRRELGGDVSEIITEAISLLDKVVLEARRGARLAFVPHEPGQPLREYSSPALTRLEWRTMGEESIVLPAKDFDRVARAVEAPAKPTRALRELSRRRRRERP